MRHTFNRTASPFPLSFRTRTGVSFGGGGGHARPTPSIRSNDARPIGLTGFAIPPWCTSLPTRLTGVMDLAIVLPSRPPLLHFVRCLFARDLLVSRVILNNLFFCISLLLLMEWCLTLEHCSIKVVGKLVDELKSMQYWNRYVRRKISLLNLWIRV